MSRVKKISSILLKVVFIGIAVILIYMPIVVIALQSFNGSKNNEIFTEFSGKWYGGLFYPEGFLEGNDVQNASDLQEAIVNTLMVTTLSTIISTILGVIFAIGIHSLSRKKRQRMILLNNVPIINADIVTGVTLMIVFSIIFSELGFTSLLLSHIFFCIPYVVLSVLPKLSEIDNNLYDAAVDLGCNSVKAIWKVILPAIKSGIIMGMLLAFTMSIDDFTISFFTGARIFNNVSMIVYLRKGKALSPSAYAYNTILTFGILFVLIGYNIYIHFKNNKKNIKNASK